SKQAVQIHGKHAALAGHALHANLSPMHLHQLPRDRQSEARSTVAAAHAAICLGELIEDMRQLLVGDSDARVFHLESKRYFVVVTVRRKQACAYPTLLRELHRVA